MLAAANRLRHAADINRVYKRGSYGSAEGQLSLKALANHLSVARVVVVVGKKVDKRAVIRNRIRRRLVALLRDQWGTVPAGYDIVVSVHANLSELPPARLQALLTTALQRARLSPHS